MRLELDIAVPEAIPDEWHDRLKARITEESRLLAHAMLLRAEKELKRRRA